MKFYTIYYINDFSQVIFYNVELDIEVVTDNVSGMFNQSPTVEIKQTDLLYSIGKYGLIKCDYYITPENVKILET